MKIVELGRDSLFVLLIIYFSQGSLYESGSFISQGALAIILGISGFYLIKTLLLKNNKSLFYYSWTALLLLNVFGYLFTAEYSNTGQFSMFKAILISLMPFYPFYYFAESGNLKSKHLIRFLFLIIPVTILSFFTNQKQILSGYANENLDIVNNISYDFVRLIPFVFLFRKRRVVGILIIMIFVYFIIQGAKRGALIAGGVSLFIYLLFLLRSVNKQKRLGGIVVSILALLGISYYAYSQFSSNDFVISRMTEFNEGSAEVRQDTYKTLFNVWVGSNSYIHLLFGFGFAASLNIDKLAIFAHNDWLELLSNFGLLGVIIYFLVFYSLIIHVINRQWNIDKRLLTLCVFVIWTISSLVSMGYAIESGVYQAVLLAFLFGNKSSEIE